LPASLGFLRTRITLSPLRNILGMYLSLFTGFAFFLPLPVFGVSVHISLTFSSSMLQCLSNAFTLHSNFLLFLQLINTCVLFLTLCVSTDNGPVLNSSSSLFAISSSVSSLLGLFIIAAAVAAIVLLFLNSGLVENSWCSRQRRGGRQLNIIYNRRRDRNAVTRDNRILAQIKLEVC